MTKRVLLLGATGPTGQHLLAQGLEHGHELTALVRRPERLTVQHPRLRVVTGDATDAAAVEQAVEAQEAVLCALGTRSPRSLIRCHLMTDSMSVLVAAMQRHGVRRLILLSALGAGQSAPRAPLGNRLAFQTLLRQIGKDKAAAEEHVRSSDLDWTIVYPPSLTDGGPSGDYRSGETLDLKGAPKIARGDVAHFMLTQLEDSAYSRKNIIISSSR